MAENRFQQVRSAVQNATQKTKNFVQEVQNSQLLRGQNNFTLDDHYQNYDQSVINDYDNRESLINGNVTGNNILQDLVGGDTTDVIIKLLNTSKTMSLRTELGDILNQEATSDMPNAYGKLVDLNKTKFTYGINDATTLFDENYYQRITDKIEDPTILSFTIDLELEKSPLFGPEIERFIGEQKNYFGVNRNIILTELEANPLTSEIDQLYSNPYGHSLNLLTDFRQAFQNIFQSFESPERTNHNFDRFSNKQYYIEEITGLEKLDKKWTGTMDGESFETDFIEVRMREDVRMSARHLYFLYNSLTQNHMAGKNMIPENLLRFDMWIKISEVRNFTSLRYMLEVANPSAAAIINAIRKDVTAIYYYVQDCNLVFDNLHSGEVSSYSSQSPTEYADLRFKIKFRRAFRVFKPTLLMSEVLDANFDSAQNAVVGPVFHFDERIFSQAIMQKYYDIGAFQGLTDSKMEHNAKRKTLTSPGKSFLRMQDKFHGKTLSEMGNAPEQYNIRDIYRAGANAYNLGANFMGGKEIPNSIDQLAQNTLRKAASAAGNTINQTRNRLLADLRTKIQQSDTLGVPMPSNVYKETNQNLIEKLINSFTTLTDLDLVNRRTNPGQYNPNQENVPNDPEFQNLHQSRRRGAKEIMEDKNKLNQDLNKTPRDPYKKDGNFPEDYHTYWGLKTAMPENKDRFEKRPEPEGDLHPKQKTQIQAPNQKIYPKTDSKIEQPSGDVHPESNFRTQTPNLDLHPTVETKINMPEGNLNPEAQSKSQLTQNNLHPETGDISNLAEQNLNEQSKHQNQLAEQNLHDKGIIEQHLTDQNLNPEITHISQLKDQNLNPVAINPNQMVENNLIDKTDFGMQEPTANLHPKQVQFVNLNLYNLHPEVEHETTAPQHNVSSATETKIQEPEGNVMDKVPIKINTFKLGNVYCP